MASIRSKLPTISIGRSPKIKQQSGRSRIVYPPTVQSDVGARSTFDRRKGLPKSVKIVLDRKRRREMIQQQKRLLKRKSPLSQKMEDQMRQSTELAKLQENITNANVNKRMETSFLSRETGLSDDNIDPSPNELSHILRRSTLIDNLPSINHPESFVQSVRSSPLQKELQDELKEMEFVNAIEKAQFIKKLRDKITRNIYDARERIEDPNHPSRTGLRNLTKTLAKERFNLRRNKETKEENVVRTNHRIMNEVKKYLSEHPEDSGDQLEYRKETLIYLSILFKEIKNMVDTFKTFVTLEGYVEDPGVQARLKYILGQYVLVKDRIQDMIEMFEVEDMIPGVNGNRERFQPNLYIHFLYPLLAHTIAKDMIDQMLSNLFEDGRNSEDIAKIIIHMLKKMRGEISKINNDGNVSRGLQGIQKDHINGMIRKKCIQVTYEFKKSSNGSQRDNPIELFYDGVEREYQRELTKQSGNQSRIKEYLIVNITRWDVDKVDPITIQKFNRFRSYKFTRNHNHYEPESIYFVKSVQSGQDPQSKGSLSYIPVVTVITRRLDKYFVYSGKSKRPRTLTPFDMKNMLQFGLPYYILYRVGSSV